jgi:5-hydroxyisourate hydrolase
MESPGARSVIGGEDNGTTMGDDQPTVSTHVLDTEHGRPAAGVSVSLFRREGDAERLVGEGTTDADGRISRLLEEELLPGAYRLVFDLEGAGPAESAEAAGGGFFRRVTLDVAIDDPTRSYHVPLLVAPFAVTTYRGS